MTTTDSRAFLVQVGDGRTTSPVAVFGDEATANSCVEELRGNRGARVAMHWGAVVFEVTVPERSEFEIIEVSMVPAGEQPTTRIVG